MFKKKQARFFVSVPYELRENKLFVQPVSWPDQCPCCGEKDDTALGKYTYKHSARYSQTASGSKTTTSSFPLEWQVPYCLHCLEHMKIAENWKIGIITACLFLPMILVLIIDASSTMLFIYMYAGFIIAGYLLYKIILASVVRPKLKATCLSHDQAFWASSPPTEDLRIIFNFDTEEYARSFAALNSADLEVNA